MFEKGFVEGFVKGIDKGFMKGFQQAIEQVAGRMLGLGIDIPTIMKVTELTKEQVEDIENGYSSITEKTVF